MGWRVDEDAIRDLDAVVSEDLIRDDDGRPLGSILRLKGNPNTYSYFYFKCKHCPDMHAERMGAFISDDAAREAVENARKFFNEDGKRIAW